MLVQKGFQPIFGGGIVALILREDHESTLELSWCLLYTMGPLSKLIKLHLKVNFKIYKIHSALGTKSSKHGLYGRPVRKSPSLHGRKSTPTPKFLGTAKACFV